MATWATSRFCRVLALTFLFLGSSSTWVQNRVNAAGFNGLPIDASISAITAKAEDSAHTIHQLPVEYVGKTPNSPWLTTIVVKLPDSLTNAGDVRVSIAVRNVETNKALLRIQ